MAARCVAKEAYLMISVEHVSFSYDVKPVLTDVCLNVAAGSVLAVMGPNGMGKSTLLGLIGGVLPIQRGVVRIDDNLRRSSVEAEKKIRQHLYYLPYDAWLPTDVSCENILFKVGQLYGHEKNRIAAHIDLLLNIFHLNEKRGALVGSLSTGQYKKMLLCTAFVSEAPYLILDEPFSGGLDPAAILALQEMFRHIAQDKQRIVVIASPVPELHAELADRVALIDHGRLSFFGSPQELMEKTTQKTFEEAVRHMSAPEQGTLLDQYREAF